MLERERRSSLFLFYLARLSRRSPERLSSSYHAALTKSSPLTSSMSTSCYDGLISTRDKINGGEKDNKPVVQGILCITHITRYRLSIILERDSMMYLSSFHYILATSHRCVTPLHCWSIDLQEHWFKRSILTQV